MRILIAAALLGLAVPATADPARTPDAPAMHTDDCAKARKQNKPCVLDMGKGEQLDGNGVTPTGSATSILDFGKAGSLIRIRRDFIVEILKTADDL